MTVKFTRPSINIRETLDQLNKPSGIAGNAMLAAETPQEQFNLIGAGRKNLIINGGFDVWQRGTSQSAIGWGADRWHTSSPSSISLVKEADSLYGNVTALTISNPDTNYVQPIENLNGLLLSKEVTLSFLVKSDTVTSSKIMAYDGSAFTLDIEYDITSSWTKVTKTFNTGSSYTAGTTFRLYILRTSNTTGTVRFAQVQLELGSVATPFEHRSYGEELTLCQRYYERINGTSPWFFGHGYNSQVYLTVEWKVTKRVSGGTVYYSDQGAPASMFTLYGNTGSSGAIDGVITSVSLSNAAVTALAFI